MELELIERNDHFVVNNLGCSMELEDFVKENLDKSISRPMFDVEQKEDMNTEEFLELVRQNTQNFEKNYQLIKKIGQGSFSVVWEIQNTKTQEKYAMKCIKNQHRKKPNPPDSDPIQQTEIHQEISAEVLRELVYMKSAGSSVVNLIMDKPLFWSNGNEQVLVIIQKLMSASLREFIDKNRSNGHEICAEDRRYIMYKLLQCVENIHANQIIHKDLKPDNILFTSEMELKLGDLGMAERLWTHSKDKDLVIGTNGYLAPEILLGDCMYDQMIDIWAVGCIFAELVLNKLLFPLNYNPQVNYSTRDIMKLQLEGIVEILGTPTFQEDEWLSFLVCQANDNSYCSNCLQERNYFECARKD